MIRRLLLNITLQIIRFNGHNVLITQDKNSSVIFCFCCEEHLRVRCNEITNSLNINHLTLNPETGRNDERGTI